MIAPVSRLNAYGHGSLTQKQIEAGLVGDQPHQKTLVRSYEMELVVNGKKASVVKRSQAAVRFSPSAPGRAIIIP